MRPPEMVDSLVRWQASMVPARVLEMVASTVPRPISVSTTAIGFGRPSHQTAAAIAATIAAPYSSRRGQGFFGVVFIRRGSGRE